MAKPQIPIIWAKIIKSTGNSIPVEHPIDALFSVNLGGNEALIRVLSTMMMWEPKI